MLLVDVAKDPEDHQKFEKLESYKHELMHEKK